MVSRSPRSFASRRWCTRTRFGVGMVNWPVIRGAPVGWSRLAPAGGDGQPTVAAEGQRGHLGTRRVLAPLPLGAVHEREDLVDDVRVEAAREQLRPALGVLDVGVQHLVE